MENVVWITGCSRGLGQALATKFKQLGWVVAGCSRAGDGAGIDFFAPCDVSSDEATATFCAAALQATGPPALLLNNAGVMNRCAPLWEVPAAEFDKLTAVNINGVANVIRHTAPAMIERGSGMIVNFSSGWGRSASADVAPYCATKFAVEGLTRALAHELPPGVATVSFNPGVIDTDMLRSCWADGAASYIKPAEWAETAAPFLASIPTADNGRALTAP